MNETADYNWIHVSDALPEEDTYVLITIDDEDSAEDAVTTIGYMFNERWFVNGIQVRVAAWQPLPKPFNHLTY